MKTNTNEKLKRIKLARELLLLEQETAAWHKKCRPAYPGKADWELRKEKYYKEQLFELNNARYQTLLFDLRSLIVAQKKKRNAAEGRAETGEASLV
ncbi:MAG: hypothetical protein L3J05_10410 [Robiginitomaculum sp.]|nr:hypothetical protein [Robiginitomaculum sp.]